MLVYTQSHYTNILKYTPLFLNMHDDPSLSHKCILNEYINPCI